MRWASDGGGGLLAKPTRHYVLGLVELEDAAGETLFRLGLGHRDGEESHEMVTSFLASSLAEGLRRLLACLKRESVRAWARDGLTPRGRDVMDLCDALEAELAEMALGAERN